MALARPQKLLDSLYMVHAFISMPHDQSPLFSQDRSPRPRSRFSEIGTNTTSVAADI